MKHLLNDLSQEEKNRILEQHNGGKKLVIENFNKLVNNKLGSVKPLINEMEDKKEEAIDILKDILKPSEIDFLKKEYEMLGKEGLADEVVDVIENDDEVGELTEEMSEKEYKLRHIINKIIKGGVALAGLGIVPAAMFVSGGLAAGLGVASLAGMLFKDAAFWDSKGDIDYKELEKSDSEIGNIIPDGNK